MPAGDGGEALVYRGMLTGARRRYDHQRHGGGNSGETEGGGVDCCGRAACLHWERRWQGKERVDHVINGDGMLGGPGGTFISKTIGVVLGLEDVVNETAGEGSEVLDGLHSGVRPSGIP